MDYRGLLRGVVTYLTRTTASCFDMLIQSTPSYQRMVYDESKRCLDAIGGLEARFRGLEELHQRELTEVRRRLAEAEQRATLHAERAIMYQEEAGLTDPSILIPRYEEMKARLEKAKHPFIITTQRGEGILYLSERIQKGITTACNLLGRSFSQLRANSAYLSSSSDRFSGDVIKIGDHVYRIRRIRDIRGFRIINLEHVGQFERFVEMIHATMREALPKKSKKIG